MATDKHLSVAIGFCSACPSRTDFWGQGDAVLTEPSALSGEGWGSHPRGSNECVRDDLKGLVQVTPMTDEDRHTWDSEGRRREARPLPPESPGPAGLQAAPSPEGSLEFRVLGGVTGPPCVRPPPGRLRAHAGLGEHGTPIQCEAQAASCVTVVTTQGFDACRGLSWPPQPSGWAVWPLRATSHEGGALAMGPPGSPSPLPASQGARGARGQGWGALASSCRGSHPDIAGDILAGESECKQGFVCPDPLCHSHRLATCLRERAAPQGLGLRWLQTRPR